MQHLLTHHESPYWEKSGALNPVAKGKIETEKFDEWLSREHGTGTLITADDLVDRKRDILPTILSLDISLSGGIPDGSTCLLSGKPKAGKTSLCLQILKNAIDLERPAFYFDIERRCKAGLLQTIQDLKLDKLNMIREGDRDFSAEQWLDILERVIKSHPKAVIVVDSIAMLSTLTEQTEDIGSRKADMSGPQKLLSKFFRRMQRVIDSNDIIIIFISQLMTNRDPTSRAKWVEKGGIGIQYAVSVWINVTWTKQWTKNADTQAPDGHDIMCKIITSPLGKPFMPCVIPLRYGKGLDAPTDIMNHAENLGLIEKKGAWYSIPKFSKDEKFHGLENLRSWLLENPESMAELEREVRSMAFGHEG